MNKDNDPLQWEIQLACRMQSCHPVKYILAPDLFLYSAQVKKYLKNILQKS